MLFQNAITNSVQKAAIRSSNMMPNPPVKRRSKNRIGDGLTISKRRKSANAAHCIAKEAGIMNAKRARRRAAGNHADAEAGDDQRNPMRWCEYAFEQYKGEPAEQRADGARHPRKESAAEAKRNPVKRVRA